MIITKTFDQFLEEIDDSFNARIREVIPEDFYSKGMTGDYEHDKPLLLANMILAGNKYTVELLRAYHEWLTNQLDEHA